MWRGGRMKENSKSVSDWVRDIQAHCPMVRWDSVGVNARKAFCKETDYPCVFRKCPKNNATK